MTGMRLARLMFTFLNKFNKEKRMTTYQVEVKRTTFITYTVDESSEDSASEQALLDVEQDHGEADYEVVSVKDQEGEKSVNKPHKHAALIKAWADGAEIQVKLREWEDCTNHHPTWDINYEYRLKSEAKPDIEIYGMIRLEPEIELHMRKAALVNSGTYLNTVDNVKLTFDGETGKLKHVEMFKA